VTARASSECVSVADVAAPLAFDDVYAAHFEYTYRVVVRLAGRAHAEDLTQEVFAVVHRRLAEWRGEAKLTTWLFQIAYRVVGSHVRRERLRRLLGAGVREHVEVATPLGDLERVEESRRLAGALARLSWTKRAVLVLHEVEGWSCELIAERMGNPVGTVWTRLHHARRELAAALERDRMRARSGGVR